MKFITFSAAIVAARDLEIYKSNYATLKAQLDTKGTLIYCSAPDKDGKRNCPTLDGEATKCGDIWLAKTVEGYRSLLLDAVVNESTDTATATKQQKMYKNVCMKEKFCNTNMKYTDGETIQTCGAIKLATTAAAVAVAAIFHM